MALVAGPEAPPCPGEGTSPSAQSPILARFLALQRECARASGFLGRPEGGAVAAMPCASQNHQAPTTTTVATNSSTHDQTTFTRPIQMSRSPQSTEEEWWSGSELGDEDDDDETSDGASTEAGFEDPWFAQNGLQSEDECSSWSASDAEEEEEEPNGSPKIPRCRRIRKTQQEPRVPKIEPDNSLVWKAIIEELLLRREADLGSVVVARLPQGSLVYQVGPCVNLGGAIRMPVEFPAKNGPGGRGKSTSVAWVTVDALALGGPVLLERAVCLEEQSAQAAHTRAAGA